MTTTIEAVASQPQMFERSGKAARMTPEALPSSITVCRPLREVEKYITNHPHRQVERRRLPPIDG